MIQFTATIKKFGEQGEKTGWTYIDVPVAVAQQLKPDHKKAFRVKGKLDDYIFGGISLTPIGGGNFIMALNATIRKSIRKEKGATVQVAMKVDEQPILPPAELIACLQDEPKALTHFYTIPKSHQHYFIRWIESAKTEVTKAVRIAQSVTALATGRSFSEMLRSIKENRLNKR